MNNKSDVSYGNVRLTYEVKINPRITAIILRKREAETLEINFPNDM